MGSRLNRPTYLKNKSLINRVKRINRPKTSHKQAFKQNRQFSSKLKVFPKLRPKSVLLKKHCAKVFVRPISSRRIKKVQNLEITSENIIGSLVNNYLGKAAEPAIS